MVRYRGCNYVLQGYNLKDGLQVGFPDPVSYVVQLLDAPAPRTAHGADIALL
jgi:hypothetical protein